VIVLTCYSETWTKKKQDKQIAITGMRFLQNLVCYTGCDSLTNTKMWECIFYLNDTAFKHKSQYISIIDEYQHMHFSHSTLY